jgi:hypothetical protein
MSTNCIRCGVNKRHQFYLFCESRLNKRGKTKSGDVLISVERLEQQFEKHGPEGVYYTVERDLQYKNGELAGIATGLLLAYVDAIPGRSNEVYELEENIEQYIRDKYREDPVKVLTIAGAFIAAEIDRLQITAYANSGNENAVEPTAEAPILLTITPVKNKCECGSTTFRPTATFPECTNCGKPLLPEAK